VSTQAFEAYMYCGAAIIGCIVTIVVIIIGIIE